MTILWGDTFPTFHLVKKLTQTDTWTGDGTTQMFSITLKDPEKNTIQITASYTSGGTNYTEVFTDDGQGNMSSDLGGTGMVDYNTGNVTLTLANIPDDGTDVVFDSNWYAIDYEITFDAPELVDVKPQWLRVPEYELVTFAKVVKQNVKWRGIFTIELETVNSFTVMDNLRLIYSWRSENVDRKVVMFPRPNYLGGFFVVPQDDFDVEYLAEHKWIGQKKTAVFITENVYDEIPTHTGGVCDVNY